MDKLFYYNTKIGRLGIREDHIGITNIYFREINTKEDVVLEESYLIKKAYIQIEEYIDGKRTKFELPLNLKGTEFQKNVWRELIKIP